MIVSRRRIVPALTALAMACTRSASAEVDAAAPTEAALERCWQLAVADAAAAERFVAPVLERELSSPADEAATADVAELRLCRGYAREQAGRPAEAAADYELAVGDGERLLAARLLASALALRGELAYYRGAFDAALADFDRAYALEVELGRKGRQRYVLNAIANVYADARVGAYDRALDYYRQLLALHAESGDPREVATRRSAPRPSPRSANRRRPWRRARRR